MGGIAGIIHFRGDAPDRDEVKKLFLGPSVDTEPRVFQEKSVQLLHRRKRPDDLDQPVVSPRFALIVNGRIWEGWKTLLERWEAVGLEALREIIGPFAVAVWDRQASVLWLARGAVGTRTLFYARHGEKVAFATEMAPLVRLDWVSRDVAIENLAEYLSFRYVHSPRTLLTSVRSVPPGHVLRIDRTGERMERWWVPPWAPPGTALGDDREAADRVDAVLRRAVERRLRGGSAGVLLSGGLDSSAILHHARTMGAPPPTFTVTFDGERSSEAPIAARIAKVMGAPHHTVKVSPEALIDAIEPCTEAMGAPIPGPAAMVQYLLFQQVRGFVNVALSGEGGDEVLGGRGMGTIAAGVRATEALGILPGPARGLARRVAGRLGLDNLAASGDNFGLERVIGGSDVFSVKERVAILRDPALVRPGVRRTVLEPIYQQVTSDPLNEILHVRQVGWLCEDTIARSERMAAHADLEVRYPMLDREMLEVTAAMPGFMKVRRNKLGYTTKWPLRQAMVDRIPTTLLHRPKRSFPTPLDRWLRGAGVSFLVERTEAICSDPDGLFDPDAVRRLVTEHRSGHKDHAVRLWTLIFFHVWKSQLG